MKKNAEIFWAIVGKKYTPLCADKLLGAKVEATRMYSNNNITIMRNNKTIARKQAGAWLHV
jgi:hypothetical protein